MNTFNFRNGYIDLSTGDFVSLSKQETTQKLSTFADYDFTEFSEDSQDVIEFNSFIDKLFPNQDVKYKALSSASSLLENHDGDINFLFLYGSGQGKSVWANLLNKTLDSYSAFVDGLTTPIHWSHKDKKLLILHEWKVTGELQNENCTWAITTVSLPSDFSKYDKHYEDGTVVKFEDRVTLLHFESVFKSLQECDVDYAKQLQTKIFPRDSEIDKKIDTKFKHVLAWKMRKFLAKRLNLNKLDGTAIKA